MNIFTKVVLTTLFLFAFVSIKAQDIGPQIDVDFVRSKSHTGWMTPTSGAAVMQDPLTGIVTVSPTATEKYRGDFRYTGGKVYIHPVDYPIIAIKLTKPSTGNITFDTSHGDYRKPGSGSQNNQQTALAGYDNVYYYDLTDASGAKLSAGKEINTTNFTYPIECTSFQFKIADMTIRETYDFYWIKAFSSVAELQSYVAKTVTDVKALAWNSRVDLSWKAVTNADSYTIRRFTADNPAIKTEIAAGITNTHYSNTGLTNGTTYYYEVTAVVDGVEGAYESAVEAIPIADASLNTWSHQDIGTSSTIGITGNAGFGTNGVFTINAAGANIWQGDDGFHFVYQELEKDGLIIAKIESLANTGNAAKAGIMIRETLNPGSRQALASFKSDFTPEFGSEITGSNTAYPAVNVSGSAGTYRWVKLERQGAVITSYYSVDGNSWEEGPNAVFTTGNIASGKVYIGLFAVSNTIAKLTTATFSNINVITGTTPVSLTGYTAKLANNGNVELHWTVASEQNNDYFTIEHKRGDEEFAVMAQVPSKGAAAANYSFIDKHASEGVNYYRLSQTDKNGSKTDLGIQSLSVSLDKNQTLRIYPQPISGNELLFKYSASSAKVAVKLFDLSGKIVYQVSMPATTAGNYSLELKSRPAPGIYILLVDDKEKQRVILQ